MRRNRPGAAGAVPWRTRGARSPGEHLGWVWAFPVVEFELPDGQTVRAQTRTGRYPKPASVGDTVRVLYDPTQPSRVDLASQAPRTFLHTVYALLSFSFASGGVLGVLMWWLLFRVMGIPA